MVDGGRVVVRAGGDGAGSFVVSSRATSPLKILQPSFPSLGKKSAAICVVTFGGGLVDGDAIDLTLDVEAGATLLVFTQASTKVFVGSSRQRIRANVEGTLVLLPDPVAAFKGASYTQQVDVSLGARGACVLLDGFTSGRPAFGERWAMRSLDLRTEVRENEQLIVRDALRLDEADGSIAARMQSTEACATLLAVGRGVQPIIDSILHEPIDPPTPSLIAAATALPRARATPGAIARFAASSPALALSAVRSRLRNLPDIDAVDPFASRH